MPRECNDDVLCPSVGDICLSGAVFGTANVLMIQSLPFLNVKFLHCLQNQQIHRLRDSQKICSADEPF